MPTEHSFTIAFLGAAVVRGSQNRLEEALHPTLEGAQAALETFYYAFNERSLALFRQVWLADPLMQLHNPIGG